MTRHFTLFSLLAWAFGLTLLTSCNGFEGSQTVPAYIRIDSVGLDCDYFTYGANTSRFTDVWIYVDDNGGPVELPAVFPVLKEGIHSVRVRAAIRINGIQGTKVVYPFVEEKIYPEVNLVPDSIVTLRPVLHYYPISDNFHVTWLEDFDGSALTIARTSGSDTTLMRISGPQAWHDAGGLYSTQSGEVVLTSDTMAFTIATIDALSERFSQIPTTGEPSCIMEMDYKCSDTLLMGLVFEKDLVPMEYPLLRIRPTCDPGEEPTEWRKIYINIGPDLIDNKDYAFSKIYLASWPYRNEGTQYFYFDNLKLMYRDR